MRQIDMAAFIKDTDKWPCWPALPVKRQLELGFIWYTDLTCVYLGNIFSEEMPSESKKYASVEELLADGWVVD